MNFPSLHTIEQYIDHTWKAVIERQLGRLVTIGVEYCEDSYYKFTVSCVLDEGEFKSLAKNNYLDQAAVWDEPYKTVKYRLALFHLTELPGCCGVCVSFGAYISSGFRRKGLGRLMNKMRQGIARMCGYTCFLCTDIDTNEPQKKILSAEGFDTVFDFINARTGNRVNISCLDLREKHG